MLAKGTKSGSEGGNFSSSRFIHPFPRLHVSTSSLLLLPAIFYGVSSLFLFSSLLSFLLAFDVAFTLSNPLPLSLLES